MKTAETWMMAILVVGVVYLLLRPGNQGSSLIQSLGKANFDAIRSLTGQYDPGKMYGSTTQSGRY